MFDRRRGSHSFTYGAELPVAVSGAKLSRHFSTLDRQLISILQQDGRRTFAAIAREVGVPEKTVRRRVKELVDSGAIQITTVADPRLFGFHMIAMIAITIDPGVPVTEVVGSFLDLEAVDYAVITTGRYNALIEVLCRDSEELLTFVDSELPARPGIRSAEVLPYLDLHFQEPSWEAAQSKPRRAPRGPGLALQPVDQQIMRVLHTDGRMPFAGVGQAVGLSESQVRKRVSRLVDRQAMRITAVVNPRHLGFDTVVWVAIKTTRERRASDVAEELTHLPFITYVAITAGRFDILAEAVCRTAEDVMRLVEHDFAQVEGLADTEVMFCLDLYYEAINLPGDSIAAAGAAIAEAHRPH
ncbi:AsnC family transcriptional regulator [Nocardioides glacieisoli]|uniref:AsnC family transcriptional regulator n=2 Tax=Nocardioides glacieisoli TaxID=1168730 RepID=A0A4Q2RUH2_9ACTN|nr:AsnC family transcriptional regulator [Nocardioides glacieisoli]